MPQPTSAYRAYPMPLTPDTVGDLIAFHRATFGGFSMETPAPTDPPAGAPADTPPPSGGAPAGGQTPPADTPPAGDAGKTFTQADLDRIINDRLAKAQTTFDQKLAEIQATAGKTELEAAQIKAQGLEEKLGTVTQASAQRIAATEAKLAAHLAGGKADRLQHIVAQADLTAAVADDGTVDEAKVAEAIGKVLEQFPEWKGATIPSSSGGELTPGAPGAKPTYTRAEITSMTEKMRGQDPAEARKTLAEINSAMAEGRIKG